MLLSKCKEKAFALLGSSLRNRLFNIIVSVVWLLVSVICLYVSLYSKYKVSTFEINFI